MQGEHQPITGTEEKGDQRTPYQALVQFYDAFNRGDLAAMADNWLQSAEIAMDNPLGGITRGWSAISEVYRAIFSGPAQVYVEYYDYTIHQGADIFYAVGRERGFFKKGGDRMELAIRTSRIFRKVDGRWQQVHHHGSIEDPELLGRYQAAVQG